MEIPPRRRRGRLDVLLLLVAAAGACAPEGQAAPRGTTVRDSAGIRIVENADEAGPADAWRPGEGPLLRLGVMEGDSSELFYQARGARRLSDGRVVVANSGTGELRWFDREGTHLTTSGGIGQGPGEFGAIDQLFLGPGDTVYAYDLRAKRLSVFGPDGAFARSFQPPGWDGRYPRIDGVFADGSLLSYVEAGITAATGLVDDPALYFRLDGEGAVLDTVGLLPVRSYHTFEVSFEQGTGIGSLIPPFAPTPRRAVGPDRFYSSLGGRYEVAVHAPDGRLLRLVRVARDGAPVTQTHIGRFLEPPDVEGYDPNSPFARARREAIDRVGFPAVMPTQGELRVDGAGDLWVEDYRPFGEGPSRWTAFDPEGRLLGRVALPEGLAIDQIGEDFVVGRRTDDLGVEYVEVWGLVK